MVFFLACYKKIVSGKSFFPETDDTSLYIFVLCLRNQEKAPDRHHQFSKTTQFFYVLSKHFVKGRADGKALHFNSAWTSTAGA